MDWKDSISVPKADTKPVRQRRQRGSINADDIVAGAFEVARRGSLDQLSMPSLAEHLDVGVTSIYWYFRKKHDLLNRMTDVAVDRYVQKLPQVRDDTTWQEVLLEHFHSQRSTHLEDQLLSDLLFIRTSNYSRDAVRRVFEAAEAVVARMVDAGFTPDDALLAYNAASVYTRGIIIHDRILRLSDTPTLDGRQRNMTDWATMPVLESLVDRHPFAGTTDEDFEFGLASLIHGFEVKLAETTAEPSRTGSARSRAGTSAKAPIAMQAAAKKTAAKKTAAKKTAAKKPAVKNPAVKKPAVKKTAVKKTAAKQSASTSATSRTAAPARARTTSTSRSRAAAN
jgi:AcrR family transcriptional regulator